MAEVTLNIAGRAYLVACRTGEEDNLLAAARLVDGKCREALAGLGTLSESRQFLFASLLLADQLLEKPGAQTPAVDHTVAPRVEQLAERLEAIASALEEAGNEA
ncbi:cell division protein ZapA [Sphingomonas sp. HDW15A]|uniref:cell division protein ZapA n=1 Tax=Sphingomonas sp. HDW15A TaxID=2714942 RepID=UPI001409D6D2|nr:cell division protein ZapA [Sphingomonas sp. HDW15A]QIK95786.1 cell division protein ZapA [Sphingomonas sp. HDW15A]